MSELDLIFIFNSSNSLNHFLDLVENKNKQREELLNEKENFSLFGLFQVDLENYLKIKFAFMYHMQIPPEQIDNWPYWEYEEYIELLSDVLKKKQDAEKGSNQHQSSLDPSREANKMINKMKMPTKFR
jgi:hypothetical protein